MFYNIKPFNKAEEEVEKKLGKITRPPELVREFIDDCLYDVEHGYFIKNVNIFKSPENGIKFNEIRDLEKYSRYMRDLYSEQSEDRNAFMQLFHTPSEVFKPYYGYGVANYMVQKYKEMKYEEFVVYEIGPGTGALAKSILDYLKQYEPEIYSKAKYNLIEISNVLVTEQNNQVLASQHSQKIDVYNLSIFEWRKIEQRPCFVLAFEVLDNLAHDKVYYDTAGDVRQIMVHSHEDLSFVMGHRKYEEKFYPLTDALITRYLNLRDKLSWFKSPAFKWTWRSMAQKIHPDYINIDRIEFIPTMQLQLFNVLNHYFKNHHLIITDFNYFLPEKTINSGHYSPIVQTRYQDKTIPCDTYLLKRGLFDIFFPTDFEVMQGIYEQLGKKRKTKVMTHHDFLKAYAPYEKTRVQDGYNPMLEDFENVRFFLT